MNKYFEKMGITQAALRTEWYLTAKFVDAYINAKNDFIAEGKIDANTGEYLGGPYSNDARELVGLEPVNIDTSFIAERARMARILYHNGKYDWVPNEDPLGFRFDTDDSSSSSGED